MKIRPTQNNVLVKPDSVESRESKYGILTPSNVEQEQKATGVVQAVGPDIKHLKKGDRVIYAKFAGDPVSLRESGKEVDYFLLFGEDIRAFLDD